MRQQQPAKPIDAAVDSPKPIEAAPDTAPDARPANVEMASGTPHHFVISKEHIPTTAAEATTFGLDLKHE